MSRNERRGARSGLLCTSEQDILAEEDATEREARPDAAQNHQGDCHTGHAQKQAQRAVVERDAGWMDMPHMRHLLSTQKAFVLHGRLADMHVQRGHEEHRQIDRQQEAGRERPLVILFHNGKGKENRRATQQFYNF